MTTMPPPSTSRFIALTPGAHPGPKPEASGFATERRATHPRRGIQCECGYRPDVPEDGRRHTIEHDEWLQGPRSRPRAARVAPRPSDPQPARSRALSPVGRDGAGPVVHADEGPGSSLGRDLRMGAPRPSPPRCRERAVSRRRWIEGQNVVIDYRFADSNLDRRTRGGGWSLGLRHRPE
jgi:hypothetical protein